MPIYRLCMLCHKKTLYGTKCKCEIDKDKDNDRKRHTKYSAKRLIDQEQKKFQSFYSSDEWSRCRGSVIRNTVGIDVVEYYRVYRIVQGYTVHHIIPLEDCWDMRLDKTNLIYLSQSVHIRVHQEYLKGDKEKKAMQELLLDLKCRFIDEFALG